MWLIPELSLQSELEKEIDRRRAAHLDQVALHELVDRLIADWYLQRELLDRCLGRVRQLEVELVLSSATPSKRGPSDEHLAMARDILG